MLEGTGGCSKYNMLHHRCKRNDNDDEFIFQGGIVCCRLNEGNIPWHNICFTSTKALDQEVWFAVLWGTGQGRGREGEYT